MLMINFLQKKTEFIHILVFTWLSNRYICYIMKIIQLECRMLAKTDKKRKCDPVTHDIDFLRKQS